MSLDSIVKISIDAQTLSLAQKGFGIPLILAESDSEEPSIELYRNAIELPHSSLTAYKMALTIFSQNPTVPLLKIGFAKKGSTLAQALKAICDLDSGFYGLLLASPVHVDELHELDALLEAKRLLLGVDIDGAAVESLKFPKSDRIFCIHNTDPSQHLAAAWMAKMLPEAPGSSSWAYRRLKAHSCDLGAGLTAKLIENNINRYVSVAGIGVTLDGKALSGKFIDITHGIDWLHARLQERLFRLLVINKKIPYTLKGIDLVRSEIIAQLKEAVYQGILAADPEPEVSTPKIEEIESDMRGSRVLPQVRFSGRLAGAIHTIIIQGTVTP